MAAQADDLTSRRDQLTRRLAAIRTRIEELQEERLRDRGELNPGEQVAAARRLAATSMAAAEQAVAASVSALRRSADAHDRTAVLYENAAATVRDNADLRRQRGTTHRAAALADRQRADHVETTIPNACPASAVSHWHPA